MENFNDSGDPEDPGTLPMYLSPYENWNFGAGKGYAFPAIRKFTKFISALAEFPPHRDDQPIGKKNVNGLLPTLWKTYPELTFLPFVVENPFHREIKDATELQDLLLEGLKDAFQLQFHAEHAVDRDFVNIPHARFRVAFPVPPHAMHELHGAPANPDCKPDAGLRNRIGKDKRITIMAVIDDGLPFAHRNFRDASGSRTRVEFCWLQSAVADQDQKTVLFGREYTREQIDHFIAQYGDDEDTLYRKAGATVDTEDEEFGSLIERHATHGAHIMDLATGYAPGRGEDPAEEIRIIAVQLPTTIALDTSGFGKDMYMLAAFHYIFHRADMIANCYGIDKARLVINFSYGFSGGRHDGETELEAAIDEMIVERRKCRGPTALVLPAGNTFLERLHGEICATDFHHNAVAFPWRVQPNDRTPSYLELWFWKGFDPAGYSIELWDPWGRLRSSLLIGADPPPDDGVNHSGDDPGRVRCVPDDEGAQVGQISADRHRADDPNDENKTERWRVLIILAPTEPENDRLPGADAGKWTVVIKRGGTARLLDNPIHCWIQRAADPDMLRSGSRQSYFDDLRDVRYDRDGALKEIDTKDAFVRRFGSLNGLATGRTSLIVAGYRLGAGLESPLKCARPAPYSSAGIQEHGWSEAQVACSSMSDRSKVLPGTVAAGVRSGSLSFVQGTSTAAPFVARQLAETFVTAEESVVQHAQENNYLSLLRGYKPETDKQESLPGTNDSCRRKDDPELLKARLGAVLVAPHWQPGIERRAYGQGEASENSAACD